MQTHLVIPWGDWLVVVLTQAEPIVVTILLAIVTYLCRKLPAPLAAVLHDVVTQARIARAVDYAFAKVEGAEKGKTLAVEHVDPLTAMAAQYGETLFPQLVKQLGERFRPMNPARISAIAPIASSAAAAPLPAKPIAAVKA